MIILERRFYIFDHTTLTSQKLNENVRNSQFLIYLILTMAKKSIHFNINL